MNAKMFVMAGIGTLFIAACGLEPESLDHNPATAESALVGSQQSVIPENTLHLQDNLLGVSGITEAEFNATIERIRFLYTPLVYYHGGELNITGDWTSSIVNAYASRSGSTWNVAMHGGLARRPEITPDGFALVACHEVGHHLGGYPFYSGGLDWAAAEGQSDWYATQACTRWLWNDDVEGNAAYSTTVEPVLRAKCDSAWTATADRNLCYRIGTAGKSFADLSASLEGRTISFSTPDTTVVTTTLISHPNAQCRLDTVVAAARCTVTPNFDIIPGFNVTSGRNSAVAEVESAAVSCHPASEWMGTPGYNHSDHPRCWFKNQL
ncbi:MAG TPA: hypothetical protein VIV60_34105 [Polyangiaceae bacterium]